MSEMGEDYNPGPWTGFNYDDARKAYDNTAGRSYDPPPVVAMPGGRILDLPSVPIIMPRESLDRAFAAPFPMVPEKLLTQAKAPIVVITDGTGSMGEFPRQIFKKLPLLDLGVKDYLDDVEFSFAMIGDADGDAYPLQVQPFAKGLDLVDSLNRLKIEGGGGANKQESYDLAALYYLYNLEAPKAVIKPILIFIGDEGVYARTSKVWAKNHAKVTLDKELTDKQLFKQLLDKFSVYCIRKHYEGAGAALEGDRMIGANLQIHQQWEDLVGSDRIAILPDADRVADLILGLLAAETDKLEFFDKEMTWRQKPEQVSIVKKSMVSIGKKKTVHTGLSIAKRDPSIPAKGSKSLLE